MKFGINKGKPDKATRNYMVAPLKSKGPDSNSAAPPSPVNTPPTRFDLLAVLSFIVPLVVYLRTLCPVLFFGDSGELIAAAKVGGLAYPTGYPAYMLALALFIRLPLGWLAPRGDTVDQLAWQANLLSALFTAAGCYLFYLLVRRMIKLPLVAFAASLCLAFGRTLWQQSLIAEVYALNTSLCIGILYFDFLLLEGGKGRHLILRWLFQSFALANHPTSLFLIPLGLYTASVYILKSPDRRKLNSFKWAVLAFILGMATYLYIPIASHFNPPLDWENPETLSSFWKFISRNTYSHEFSMWRGNPEGAGVIKLAWAYFRWAWPNIGPALTPLALLGIIAAFRIRDKFRGFRLGALFTYIILLVFFWAYYIGVSAFDLQYMEVYYIINHLLAILFAVWGLVYIIPYIFPSGEIHSTLYALGTGLFLLIIAMLLCMSNFHQADRSWHLIAHFYLEDAANTVPVDKPVVLITEGDDIFIFWYAQYGRGEFKDVVLIGADTFFAQESWYWQWIKGANPDLVIPDTGAILDESGGNRDIADRSFIARLFQENKDRYDFLFTKLSRGINPETVDPAIVPYQRGLLMQLVEQGKQGEGIYLDEELLEKYNIGRILQLDTAAFDFYEQELYGRYALPLYNYGRFFAAKRDIPKSLEFFSLAEKFLIGTDDSEFDEQVKNEIAIAYLNAAEVERDSSRRNAMYGKAKDILIGLSKSNPGKAIYHAHLAKLYYREGNIPKAREEAYEALKRDPTNQFIMRLIDRIEGRRADDEVFTYK